MPRSKQTTNSSGSTTAKWALSRKPAPARPTTDMSDQVKIIRKAAEDAQRLFHRSQSKRGR